MRLLPRRRPLLKLALAALTAFILLYLTVLYLMYTQIRPLARRPQLHTASILDYSPSYWYICVYIWHSAIADYENAYWTYYSCWEPNKP